MKEDKKANKQKDQESSQKKEEKLAGKKVETKTPFQCQARKSVSWDRIPRKRTYTRKDGQVSMKERASSCVLPADLVVFHSPRQQARRDDRIISRALSEETRTASPFSLDQTAKRSRHTVEKTRKKHRMHPQPSRRPAKKKRR